MTHDLFLGNTKFDLISIFVWHIFSQLPVRVLINDPKKKEVCASTRAYDLFFDNKKFDLILWDMGDTAGNTFAKLPVCALINDPPQKSYRCQLWPMTFF